MTEIRNKRQAFRAGLEEFYQQIWYMAQNASHEQAEILSGIRIKKKPILELDGDYVIVGLQNDFITPIDIERLPKPWEYLRVDDKVRTGISAGELWLEVVYRRSQIADKKPRSNHAKRKND